jgi:hypothetical protein
MGNSKKTAVYKKIILAASFTACGLVISEEASGAFNVRLDNFIQGTSVVPNEYRYSLLLELSESFTPTTPLTLTNLVGVTNATVSGTAASRFNNPTFTSNQVTWIASSNISGNNTGGFSIFSTAPPGSVNWSFSGSGTPTSGTTIGPVPEPMTTLLGSCLALGFGGLLKREYLRKQNKLKEKANT